MHFVIHSQYYPPETGAPQARLSAFADGLTRRGHKVTVLTAMPNYPRGKIQDGYGGWLKIEQTGEIQVLHTWIYATNRASLGPRLTNYFSFVFSSFWVGLFALRDVDFLLTESPPLFLGLTGYLLARIKKARWIFNVSDLWPESAVRLGVVRDGPALRASRSLEAFCYREAWLVSGQSGEILINIKARYPSTRLYHLSNGADTSLFTPESSITSLRDAVGEGVIALYAGLHGLAQGLDQLLQVAARLSDLKNLRIVLLGDGPSKAELIRQSAQRGLLNVYFLDAVPRGEMPGMLAAADFCLVPLGLDLPGAVPSKLYEAMSAGRALVLVAQGEASRIVSESDCGLVVSPGDLSGLERAIRTLAGDGALRDRLGANGRRAALTKYDSTAIVDRFVSYLSGDQYE